MAEKQCPSCKMMIDKGAKVCPHCRKKFGLSWPLKIFLILFALFLIGKLSAPDKPSYRSSQSAEAPSMSPKEAALAAVKLDFAWSKGGFENIMMADFTIDNKGERDIKDIEITCDHMGKSGTRIDSNTRTIYDIVKAKSRKKFNKFNMGLIHSQAASSSCRISDLKVI
jgi:hypothetical protein